MLRSVWGGNGTQGAVNPLLELEEREKERKRQERAKEDDNSNTFKVSSQSKAASVPTSFAWGIHPI